jgi:hypothetical protein
MKVETGNSQMSFSAGVLEACLRAGVPAVLENPHSSWIWKAPSLTTLSGKEKVMCFVVDMCSFGEAWRKRTRLMAIGLDLSSLPPLCRSCGGKCSYSHLPHVELRGTSKGEFLTLAAQAYPKKFCTKIATLVDQVRAKRKRAKLSEFVLGLVR